MYQGVTGISGESHSKDGLTRVCHSHWHISGNHLHEYQAWLSERSFCAPKVELDQDLQGWFAILPQYSPMYLNAI
jgi:hypothetical protein